LTQKQNWRLTDREGLPDWRLTWTSTFEKKRDAGDLQRGGALVAYVLSTTKDQMATARSAEVKLGARGVPALPALDVRH
jgi:hypothetical protein